MLMPFRRAHKIPHHSGQDEFQVTIVRSDRDICTILEADPVQMSEKHTDYDSEQHKDQQLKEIIDFLSDGRLPNDSNRAKVIASQEALFTLVDGVLYYVDPKSDHRQRVAVPQHLWKQLLEENHRGLYGGHFSGPKLYSALVKRWWWRGMYTDVLAYCKRCPECMCSCDGSWASTPAIPAPHSHTTTLTDIMDLPCTESGNKHMVVFQDMFTKWPKVYAIPDQKTERITKLLCEEIVPFFGVPEALLEPISHLMLGICKSLGITKLNTTSYHPECDDMVERFNCTLKAMLRKRATQYGIQWDKHLPAVLWAYRNTPHDTTGEKPSFLLFGWDCKSPSEAAMLPPDGAQPTAVQRMKLQSDIGHFPSICGTCPNKNRYVPPNCPDGKCARPRTGAHA